MRHYVRIYAMLLKLNLSSMMAYRANFINSLISSVGWGTFQIVWVYLLTSRITGAFGWKSGELVILTATYVVFMGIFHTIFSRNFENIARIIDYGTLDSFLVKPVDSQLLLSVWQVAYTNVVRIIIGGAVIVHSLALMHYRPTLAAVAGYVTLMLFGIAIMYSIWFLVTTCLIWNPRLGNLVDFLFNITGVSRYPTEMLTGMKNVFLYPLIPLAVAVSTPARTLVGRVLAGDVLGLLILSVMLFAASRFFWKFALRSYTSASG